MIASEFYQAYKNRHRLAEEWKRTGERILGYFCNFTPEEIIYAAGFIPVRIRGTAENISLADAHMPSFCCSYMRGALDQALKGRYSYLDGMVFPKTCDMPRALYGIWKRHVKLPFYYFLPLPGMHTDEAVDFTAHELGLFRESLESFTGSKIGETSLRRSIDLYNENRRLMGEIYRLGLSENPPLSGSEMFGIEVAGLIMPKGEHNSMLLKLLGRLPEEKASSGEEGARLLIAGNNFENIELLQAVEECGGRVVINDLDTGSRYYGARVDNDADPLKAIARRYLREVKCPCKHTAGARLDRILGLARSYRVRGVIMLVQKYCDTHLYDRPWIEARLREEGYPVLSVDHSDTGWSGGKFKTMVQAFIEMLE
ncbi:MAG: 2-hydroxyacyl-CoA dehydratase [Dehalococcoidia bacterium]|nr:2-hydroxyacyl-CoA dehydratase [Dehalococcoidia bacterium]